MTKLSEQVKKWRGAAKQYIAERKEIAKWSVKQVETSIRKGETVILELFEIPPSLSAEFEEQRRLKIRAARYKLLKQSESFRRFTERRHVK